MPQRELFFFRDGLQVFVLRLFPDYAEAFRVFDAYRPPRCVGRTEAARQRDPAAWEFAHSERAGVPKQTAQKCFPLFRPPEAAQHDGRAAFFHADRGVPNVQRSRLEQRLHGISQVLRRAVVQVAGQLQQTFSLVLRIAQQGAQDVGLRKLLRSRAVSDLFDAHGGHSPEAIDKVLQQRGSRGRAQLPADLARIDRDALQQLHGGRRRHRELPVRRADGSAADMDRRGGNPVRLQQMHQIADRHHIGHRVQRAELVKVDVLHRAAVDLALGFGDQAKHRQGIRNRFLREPETAYERLHLCEGGMMVVMVMVFLLLAFNVPVDADCAVQALQAALPVRAEGQHGFPCKGPVQFLQRGLPVIRQTHQRRCQHIARGPHAAVQIKRFHFLCTSFMLPVR